MTGEESKKHKGTHKAAFPIGLAVTVLALVGLSAVIVLISTGIKNLAAKNKDYSQYNKLLTPVVLIDPSGFDDITKADMSELIEMSIWSILKSDISPDTYAVGEGGIIIPEKDVGEQFKKLFGTEVTPVHTTVEGYEYEFTYDADAKTYTIPVTGIVPIYTPKVIEKKESAGKVVLTVALIAGEAWQQSADGSMVEPEPDKYIRVTLRTQDGVQFISAIQATTTPEAATTLSSTAGTTENKDLLDKADVVAKDTSTPNTKNVTDENGENVTDEDGKNVTESAAEKSTADVSSAAP